MKSKKLGNPVTSDCFLNTQKKALNNKSLNQNIDYTTDKINNPVTKVFELPVNAPPIYE